MASTVSVAAVAETGTKMAKQLGEWAAAGGRVTLAAAWPRVRQGTRWWTAATGGEAWGRRASSVASASS